jgi:hypothetical protein
MNSLSGAAHSLQQQRPKNVTYWQPVAAGIQSELRGDIFTIEEMHGYLLYMQQNMLLTALGTDYSYTLDAVLPQIGSGLKEGANCISFPLGDTGGLSFEVFKSLKGYSPGNRLTGVQRLNPSSGKWEPAYGFFNQSCGKNFPVRRGEGYLVYKE